MKTKLKSHDVPEVRGLHTVDSLTTTTGRRYIASKLAREVTRISTRRVGGCGNGALGWPPSDSETPVGGRRYVVSELDGVLLRFGETSGDRSKPCECHSHGEKTLVAGGHVVSEVAGVV